MATQTRSEGVLSHLASYLGAGQWQPWVFFIALVIGLSGTQAEAQGAKRNEVEASASALSSSITTEALLRYLVRAEIRTSLAYANIYKSYGYVGQYVEYEKTLSLNPSVRERVNCRYPEPYTYRRNPHPIDHMLSVDNMRRLERDEAAAARLAQVDYPSQVLHWSHDICL